MNISSRAITSRATTSTSTDSFAKRLFFGNKTTRNMQIIGMCFAAPAVLGFLLFNMVPMGLSLFYSFTDFNILRGTHDNLVGFANYVRLFSGAEPLFFASVRATAHFVVLAVPANLLFAFGIAMMLNRRMFGQTIFLPLQFAFFLRVL